LAAIVLSTAAWAQEGHAAAEPKEGEHATSAEGHEEGDRFAVWKWANFAILAAVLGYMLNKALPPFFAGRTAGIQKGIADAQKLKADAEQRAAEMERRMATLESEVEALRAQAHAEIAKDSDRTRQEADQHMARIQAHAEQEIAAMTKTATLQLKAHSAELALALAEQRIQARMTGGAQGALVDRFVQQLDAGPKESRL
jgi:F-type H+-transporting ATPase subunit b